MPRKKELMLVGTVMNLGTSYGQVHRLRVHKLLNFPTAFTETGLR